jgi:hypothetical protein
MSELINTLCSGGRLIVTENSVIIKLGNIKEEALPRAGLTAAKWAAALSSAHAQ